MPNLTKKIDGVIRIRHFHPIDVADALADGWEAEAVARTEDPVPEVKAAPQDEAPIVDNGGIPAIAGAKPKPKPAAKPAKPEATGE